MRQGTLACRAGAVLLIACTSPPPLVCHLHASWVQQASATLSSTLPGPSIHILVSCGTAALGLDLGPAPGILKQSTEGDPARYDMQTCYWHCCAGSFETLIYDTDAVTTVNELRTAVGTM